MEKELTVIQSALDNVEHPCVFLLGGMKPDDSIDVMENVLSNGTADSILTTDQMLRADVNQNERIDLADATLILTYYAEHAVGNDVTFEMLQKK